MEEVIAYQIVCKLFCALDVVTDTEIVDNITEERHPPIGIDVNSRAKKLKSGMGKSSNIRQ